VRPLSITGFNPRLQRTRAQGLNARLPRVPRQTTQVRSLLPRGKNKNKKKKRMAAAASSRAAAFSSSRAPPRVILRAGPGEAAMEGSVAGSSTCVAKSANSVVGSVGCVAGSWRQGHRPTDPGVNGVRPPHGAGQGKIQPCLARRRPQVRRDHLQVRPCVPIHLSFFRLGIWHISVYTQSPIQEEARQRNRWTRLPA
jgi:ribosomal protein S30